MNHDTVTLELYFATIDKQSWSEYIRRVPKHKLLSTGYLFPEHEIRDPRNAAKSVEFWTLERSSAEFFSMTI